MPDFSQVLPSSGMATILSSLKTNFRGRLDHRGYDPGPFGILVRPQRALPRQRYSL